ncbi:MAG: PKD domain-containing protein [Promethearchaeota archaeon]
MDELDIESCEPPSSHCPQGLNLTRGYCGPQQIASFQWTPTDLYPASYMILLDNELLSSGEWNTSGESIQISVDGLAAGTYTYNLTAIDQSENSAFDLVTVIVLPRPILSPDNMIIILMIGGVAVVVIVGSIVCRSRR